MTLPAPRVTVCLPVFNGEQFLSASIKSVLEQTYQDFELIIIDDCSQDSSAKVIESYAQTDKRIRYLRNCSNVGLFANYNRCIEVSSGEFVKLFAQDDLLHPKNLESAVRALDENPNAGLYANKRAWIDDEGENISEFVQAPDCDFYLASRRSIPGKEVIRQCLCDMVNFIGEPSAVMLRKSCCADGFDTSFHHLGDLEFWLRTLRKTDFFFNDETLTDFRVHDESRSAINLKELLMAPDLLRLARKFEDLLPSFGQTYEKLLLKTSRGLAGHVRFMSLTGQIRARDLKVDSCRNAYFESLRIAVDENGRPGNPNQERILEDLFAFRELAYYSLRELGAARESESHKRAPFNRKIARLEARLGRLLNSPSWRATKVLRELRVRALARKTSGVVPESSEPSFIDPEAYAQYLNSQIRRVRSSRSWRITSPIRKIGIF